MFRLNFQNAAFLLLWSVMAALIIALPAYSIPQKSCAEAYEALIEKHSYTRGAQTGEAFEEFKKKARVVTMDDATRNAWNSSIQSLFKKLFPHHDLVKEPIEFLLIDSQVPNGFYTNVDGKPIIAITKGLITHGKSVDLIAFVLGHEYGHLRTKYDIGPKKNSKGEEIISDLYPLLAMEEAGLDATVALDFFSTDRRGSADSAFVQSLFDPHPHDVNRNSVIEAALAKISLSRGGLNRDKGKTKRTPPTHLVSLVRDLKAPKDTEKLAEDFGKRRWGEGFETEKQIETATKHLKKLASQLSQTENFRGSELESDLFNYLHGLSKTHLSEEEIDAVKPVLNSIIDLYWQKHALLGGDGSKKTTRKKIDEEESSFEISDPKDDFSFKQAIALFSKITKDLPSELAQIQHQANQFVKSSSKEDAISNARALMVSLQRNRHQIEEILSEQNGFTGFGFNMPGVSGDYEPNRLKKQMLPWHEHIDWARNDPSGEVRKALLVLGVHDKRLYELVPPDELMRLVAAPFYIASPHEISKYRSSRETVSSWHFTTDSKGNLVKAERSSGGTDHHNTLLLKDAGQKLKGVLEDLYDKAIRGDQESLDKLRKAKEGILDNYGFGHIIGSKHLLKNPELFFELNSENLFTNRLGKIHEARLANFLTHLENLAAKSPQHGKKVREIIETYMAKEALGEASTDYAEFILQDPYKLFSDPMERVRLIDRIYEYRHIPLSSYNAKRWRGLFGLTEPSDPQSLLKQLNTLKNTDEHLYKSSEHESNTLATRLRGAEVIEYLKSKGNAADFPLDEVLALLPKDLIHEYPELREALVNQVNVKQNWPSNPTEIIDLARRISDAGIFPKNGIVEDMLMRRATSELDREPNLEKKLALTEKLLATSASEWPAVRERLHEVWIESVLTGAKQKNPTMHAQEQEIIAQLDRLPKFMSQRDRYFLITELAEKHRSQKEFSGELKKRALSISAETLEKTQFAGPFVEGVVFLTAKDYHLRETVLSYLSEPLSDTNISKLENELNRSIKLHSEDASVIDKIKKEFSDKDAESRKRQLEILHANFWSAPLPIRATLIKEILLPYQKDKSAREAFYAGSLQYVLKNLFPLTEDYSIEARTILIKYGNTLSEIERPLFLAATLAAAERSRGGGKQSAGKRLAHILEIMGPAEIKLGQAIHSFDRTPEDLRRDMTIMKQDVDAPTRWSLFELFDKTVPDVLRGRIKSVEERLGAASYYYVYRVEMNDGKTYALALLKDHARDRAEAGFRKMKGLIDQLKGDDQIIRDPKMKSMVPALEELITQAQKMAAIETDYETSKRQSELAEQMYRGRKVKVNGREFDFNPARSLEIGPGYRLMEFAEGKHYNDLPVDSPANKQAKKELGIAYHTLELSNILSGKPFDEDRHGGQIKINGNQATLYDFGALKLTPPTHEELQAFGNVLYRVKSALDNSPSVDIGEKANDIFLNEIARFNTVHPENTGYLVSIHKAWLALADFRKDLSTQEMNDMFGAAFKSGKVHPDIVSGFQSQMSIKEKAKTLFSAFGGATGPIQIVK